MLLEVAKRLKGLVRDEDTVSRLGGDEFILLLLDVNAEGAAHVADKIIRSMAEPFMFDGNELTITPSIGIAMYPEDGLGIETLLQCADSAMYQAKQGGRNTYRFFTAEMHSQIRRTLRLENALRRALEREELALHYQPQFDIETRAIVGVEALLRWKHPELGMVSPADFIPIAEDSGLILPIGEWVLRTAVQQNRAWQLAGLGMFSMAVNISAVQFRQASLAQLVGQILQEYALAPEWLELELTESITMEDPELAIGILDRLHKQGVRLSIDDFGTGYSSLSYLKRFRINKLKIDQSFVQDITSDPDDEAIVDAVISLARSLKLRTIAEGVETVEQLDFLRAKGCDEIQGYFLSRPLPAQELEALLRRNQADNT
jgi:predicted signal transduction protein with EAL and GGDEF domain